MERKSAFELAPSLAEEILLANSKSREELIRSIDNPAVLEFASREILELAKDGEVPPHIAFSIDDLMTAQVKRLRSYRGSVKRGIV
jgi:hypothetical protein